MPEATEAVSGLADPGFGSGQRDNAGAGFKGLDHALDKAIAAAMGGDDEGDLPPQMVQAKKAEEDKRTKTSPETTADSEDAAKPADAQGEVPDKTAAPTGDVDKIEAPNHWPAERKQAFAGLPTDAQKAVLALSRDLEGGYTRKSQELSDKGRFADTVRQLFQDHHRQQLQRAGLDEVGAIQYLMQQLDLSTRDPVRFAAEFMRANGIRPEHLGLSVATRQTDPQQPPAQAPKGTGDPKLDALLMDPEVARLRSEYGQFSQQAVQAIQALQARIDAQEHEKAEYARQQVVVAQQSMQKQWTDFRSAQDDHGQLKHPHADTLMKQMGAIMETNPKIAAMADGPAKLDAAYQAALWASDDLRASLVEQERARAAAEAQKKADADKAKRAAAVRPATGAPTMPAKKGGLDAALDAAMTQVGWQE